MRLPYFLGTLLLSTILGCTSDPSPELEQDIVQRKQVFVDPGRDIDILFVIDNSASMQDEQRSLARNFDEFVRVLDSVEMGLPNLHLGVVSTDLGAGPYGIQNCSGDGDNGILQVGDEDCSQLLENEFFIRNVFDYETDSRIKNYTGSLSENFSCMAQLGTSGCGYEQPLEAMRRALSGENAENAGFLRENAYLAVVFVSDEDDCSVANTELFDTDPSLNTTESALGNLTSFRCFEYGVQCDLDQPREAGAKSNCKARENSEYFDPIEDYVDFLKGLKDEPSKVMVSSIFGTPDSVSVSVDEMGQPYVSPSCSSASGQAIPAIRLQSFIDNFPHRHTSSSICNDNLSDALTLISEFSSLESRCIDGDLALIDGEPDCVASQSVGEGESLQESPIPKCDESASNTPCFRVDVDSELCPDTPTQRNLTIERRSNPPSGATITLECLVQS